MSAKQTILERVRAMSDQSTWEEIVRNLIQANQQEGSFEYDESEPTEDEWRHIMAWGLRGELADSSQDIYEDMQEGLST